MNLLKHINSVPLLRPFSAPGHAANVCVICFFRGLSCLGDFIQSFPHLTVERVAIADFKDGMAKSVVLGGNGEVRKIPVGNLSGAVDCPHLEKVYIVPADYPWWMGFDAICRLLAGYGVCNIGVWAQSANACYNYGRLPEFYNENAPELEKIYHLLEDEKSRNVYAARIKAVITGNAGYLPIGSHPEYHHPAVKPQSGDIMIDGGVSDMVGAQQGFAQAVGEHGKIYGFEPIAEMCESAAASLAEFPQYQINCMGLGSARGQVEFENRHDGSRIAGEGASDTVTCRLTDLDSFVQEHGIERVDCIKLDVEGAELQALEGARQTILKHRPKLVICLYHKPEDIIAIPSFIKELAPEYKLYVAHSSCDFLDTILYARVD